MRVRVLPGPLRAAIALLLLYTLGVVLAQLILISESGFSPEAAFRGFGRASLTLILAMGLAARNRLAWWGALIFSGLFGGLGLWGFYFFFEVLLTEPDYEWPALVLVGYALIPTIVPTFVLLLLPSSRGAFARPPLKPASS